ncbi:HEL330Cp [Eremothecium sinecaudum]|uniref:HEL330Cp n=1 Tax=Eremothecium sinecaudum TaxID=45286 RepID=A0A0X8HSC2_9SACH|nr:HEL330Cp [Eremothecium sinecaudum]AMD20951.1 HEL330Cp [Eremothecium sinecaudum]
MEDNFDGRSNEKDSRGSEGDPVEADDEIKERRNGSDSDDEPYLRVSEGPYSVYPLIDNLPRDFSYTCFAAFEKNVYLGTKTGELLHYFELEPFNYVLVSQTSFDSEINEPIKAIHVLPSIERALIFSDYQLKLYLLPEFAAVPHVSPIRNVCDLAVAHYSESVDAYKVYLSKKSKFYAVHVSRNAIAKTLMYEYSDVTCMCVEKHYMMTARDNTYELINLKTKTSMELFHVTEGLDMLPPIITKFSDKEFLVTCGSSEDENAMGLIVNKIGEITQGTLVFEKYPEDIMVEAPYIFVSYDGLGVYVYELEANSEPRIVQKISTGYENLNFAKSLVSFSIFRSDYKDQVVEKLRLIPIFSINPDFRTENERLYVDKFYNEETQVVMFGDTGLYTLQTRPAILDFDNYGEDAIVLVEQFLRTHKTTTEYEIIEKGYMETLCLLLKMLHNDVIDLSLAKKWCSRIEYVDIKIFLYLCDYEVFGDLWVHQGLHRLVTELKKLKLIHKIENPLRTIRAINRELKSKYIDFLNDAENVFLSFDMVYLNLDIANDTINVDSYNEGSLSHIAQVLESKDRKKYCWKLLDIYTRLDDFQKCLEIHRDYSSPSAFAEYLLTHHGQLSMIRDYKQVQLPALIIGLLNIEFDDEDERQTVVKRVLKILELEKLDTSALLTKLDNIHSKVSLLEKLGAESSKDVNFVLEYYVSQLQCCSRKTELWNQLDYLSNNYTKEMTYLKPTLATYLERELKRNATYNEFFGWKDKINSLSYDRYKIFQIISQIDRNNVLILLFFNVEELKSFINDENKIIDMYMGLRDFSSLEKLSSPDNFIRIMDWFLTLASDGSLLHKFLARNLEKVEKSSAISAVIEHIPKDYEFASFFDIIFPVFRRYNQQKRHQDIEKAVLKNELKTLSQIITVVELPADAADSAGVENTATKTDL